MKILTKKIPTLFWPTLLFLCMLGILITLGFWQLQRYHYKKNLLQQYNQALRNTPIPFSELNTLTDIRFQHVKVTASAFYLKHHTENLIFLNSDTILLTNRLHDGKPGVEVLTPLQINSQLPLLLVNRGWIVSPRDPNAKPSIPNIANPSEITGYIFIPEKYSFFVGKNILNPGETPLIMQKLDIPLLEKSTGKKYYPFTLRLDENEPHGFYRHWEISNVTPERHLGYAVQWFVMAGVLIIAFFAWLRKGTQNEKK